MRSHHPARRTGRAVLGVLVGATAILLTACASGGSGANSAPGVASLATPAPSTAASAAPSASVDPEQAVLDFARCMREHGVDMADPVSNGRGAGTISGGSSESTDVDLATFKKANEACAPLLGNSTIDGGGPGVSAEMEGAFLAYARCMRDHGVDMPDPVFKSGSGGFSVGSVDGTSGSAIDPTSPEFTAADAACSSMLPGAPGQSPAPTGGN